MCPDCVCECWVLFITYIKRKNVYFHVRTGRSNLYVFCGRATYLTTRILSHSSVLPIIRNGQIPELIYISCLRIPTIVFFLIMKVTNCKQVFVANSGIVECIGVSMYTFRPGRCHNISTVTRAQLNLITRTELRNSKGF